jgi:hypothetical protein
MNRLQFFRPFRLQFFPQSAQDDVSGPDAGLYVRKGHGDDVVAGRAPEVRHVGGEIVLHPVQDALDRYSQAIHPPEGDHPDNVIHLAVKLDKVVVPAKQDEPLPHMVEDKV